MNSIFYYYAFNQNKNEIKFITCSSYLSKIISFLGVISDVTPKAVCIGLISNCTGCDETKYLNKHFQYLINISNLLKYAHPLFYRHSKFDIILLIWINHVLCHDTPFKYQNKQKYLEEQIYCTSIHRVLVINHTDNIHFIEHP